MVAFTAKFLQNLKPPASGRDEYNDDALKGLTLRVSSTGSMTWNLRYTIKRSVKPQQRVTLGPYPQISLKDARARARDIVDAAQQGIDLIEQENRQKDAEIKKKQKENENTVTALVDRYMNDYRQSNRQTSYKVALSQVNFIKQHLGDMPVAAVKRGDVMRMLELKGRTITANRIWARMSTFLSWCVTKELIEHNVCRDVTRRDLQKAYVLKKEKPRERVLTDDELKAVYRTFDKYGYPAGLGMKLILMTGCRRDEVFESVWPWYSLEAGEMVIPGSFYKTGRTHFVPLSTQAIDIVQQAKGFSKSQYAFTGTKLTDRPFASFGKLIIDMRRDSGVSDWTPHDLRRTVRTKMAELGVLDEIAERVIGHAVGTSVSRVYNHYEYKDERIEAIRLWCDHLDKITR